MKKMILYLCFISLTFAGYGQSRPEWVAQRPINTMYYIGIGTASKADKDYMQKAKQNALSDLVSEIKVEVSSNSLLSTMENEGEVKSVFEETIRLNARESIQQFQLVESWQNDTEYWVYYQLNKFDYEEYIEKRREQAIKQGFDYWYKGQVALQQGDLMPAIELFVKGLEAIQPAINDELTCSYEGQTMDVGRELYAALKGVFTGITITTSPESVDGKAFQAVEQPVVISVRKNGVGLRSLNLKSAFIYGAGQLSQNMTTDANGEVKMHILNVTSKLPRQEIHVTIDEKPFAGLSGSVFSGLVKSVLNSGPKGVVYVNIGQSSMNAFIQTLVGAEPALERAVQSLLTNNYFNVVKTPATADVTVTLTTNFKKGQKERGDMYDFINYYISVGVQIINNRTDAAILVYSIDNLQVTLAEMTTLENAKAAAIREAMKRLNRELTLALKELNISTEGDIKVPVDNTPVITPTRKPIVVTPQVTVPTTPTKPVVEKFIEGELVPNVFVRYVGKKDWGEKTILEFKVLNKTEEDYQLNLYLYDVKVINEKGEESKTERAKLGSSENDWQVKATIVPEVGVQLQLTVKKLTSAKLVQISDQKGTVKLRDLP